MESARTQRKTSVAQADRVTNLADFAIMASAWLTDYTPTDPIPIGI